MPGPPRRFAGPPPGGRPYSSALGLRRMTRNVISAPSRPEIRITTIRGAWRWKIQKSICTRLVLARANQPNRMPSHEDADQPELVRVDRPLLVAPAGSAERSLPSAPGVSPHTHSALSGAGGAARRPGPSAASCYESGPGRRGHDHERDTHRRPHHVGAGRPPSPGVAGPPLAHRRGRRDGHLRPVPRPGRAGRRRPPRHGASRPARSSRGSSRPGSTPSSCPSPWPVSAPSRTRSSTSTASGRWDSPSARPEPSSSSSPPRGAAPTSSPSPRARWPAPPPAPPS